MKLVIVSVLGFLSTVLSSPTGQVLRRRQTSAVPTATAKNGTYVGAYSSTYNQDYFLGVPFAQPPLEDLRFRNPVSLNETWTGTRPAALYATECIGYGVS